MNESTNYYCGHSRKDYRIAFYFFAAQMAIGFVSIFFIKIVYCCKSSNKATVNGIRRLFTSLQKTTFWITSICLGILEGFQTEFTPWFLDDLGASSVIVGLAASLHYAFTAVVFFLANYVLDFLGYANMISLSLAVYAVLFACFSAIQSPRLGLILHALVGSGFAISWEPSVAYVGLKSSSAGLGASAQGNVTFRCKFLSSYPASTARNFSGRVNAEAPTVLLPEYSCKEKGDCISLKGTCFSYD